MEKTSLNLFGKEHGAFQKFDYFLCGVAGSLFAYLGQTYTPHKLDNWFYCLMPSALLCLTACFVCGLRRLHLANMVIETNRKAHFAAEESSYYYDILVEHAKDPQRKTYNKRTSKEQSVDELKEMLEKNQMECKEKEIKWKALGKKAETFAILRTIFLLLGFILILASRVLQPYHTPYP